MFSSVKSNLVQREIPPRDHSYIFFIKVKCKSFQNDGNKPSITHHENIASHPLVENSGKWYSMPNITAITMEHDDGRSSRYKLTRVTNPILETHVKRDSYSLPLQTVHQGWVGDRNRKHPKDPNPSFVRGDSISAGCHLPS
jgi:hypothetical protein